MPPATRAALRAIFVAVCLAHRQHKVLAELVARNPDYAGALEHAATAIDIAVANDPESYLSQILSAQEAEGDDAGTDDSGAS